MANGSIPLIMNQLAMEKFRICQMKMREFITDGGSQEALENANQKRNLRPNVSRYMSIRNKLKR